MGQLDFTYTTSGLATPEYGDAQAHLAFTSNVLNNEGDFCRKWRTNSNTASGLVPKGVFTYPLAESLSNIPSTKAISLRALFRVPSVVAIPSGEDFVNQANNAVVGLRIKTKNQIAPVDPVYNDENVLTGFTPAGYVFAMSGGQLYSSMSISSGNTPNISLGGSLSTSAATNQWHRLRLDVIPIEHRGEIIMDNLVYYTGTGATGSVTWTKIGEFFVEATDSNFIAWGDTDLAHNGFFVCDRTSASFPYPVEGFVDSFEIRTSVV